MARLRFAFSLNNHGVCFKLVSAAGIMLQSVVQAAIYCMVGKSLIIVPAGSGCSGSPKALVVTRRKQSSTGRNGFR